MAMYAVERNHAIFALFFGLVELLFAAGIAVCSFILAGMFDASVSLTPYWAGLPYLMPGILGIVVGFTKNHCAMIGFMVVNIICCIVDLVACAVLLLVVAIWTSLLDAVKMGGKCVFDSHASTCHCIGIRTIVRGIKSCEALETVVTLILTIVAFACINCMASFAASIVGCAWVCCVSHQQQQQPCTVIIHAPPQGATLMPACYGYPPRNANVQQACDTEVKIDNFH